MLWAKTELLVNGKDGNFYGDAPNQETARWVQDRDVNIPGTYATVYARWLQECRQSASIGNAIVEGEQALSMIANRAFQLRQMFLSLKRGRFGDFAAYAGLNRIERRRKTRGSQAAGLWLEYHFGWEPLIKDIYDAVQIIQGPLPSQTKVATAKNSGRYVSGSVNPNLAYQEIPWELKIRLQGRLETSNPNLAVASQLGLTNPLSLLWEVTPFSFVVDWFLPVGNFLDNLTNMAGMTQVDCQAAYKRVATGFDRVAFTDIPGLDIGKFRRDSAYSFQRSIGELPLPKLAFKPFKGISVSRAATSISLLIATLRTGLNTTHVGRRG